MTNKILLAWIVFAFVVDFFHCEPDHEDKECRCSGKCGCSGGHQDHKDDKDHHNGNDKQKHDQQNHDKQHKNDNHHNSSGSGGAGGSSGGGGEGGGGGHDVDPVNGKCPGNLVYAAGYCVSPEEAPLYNMLAKQPPAKLM